MIQSGELLQQEFHFGKGEVAVGVVEDILDDVIITADVGVCKIDFECDGIITTFIAVIRRRGIGGWRIGIEGWGNLDSGKSGGGRGRGWLSL